MIDWREHIGRDPEVMLGKPIIKGTRLTVELILERLAEGSTHEDILQSYPRLKQEHIYAALAYATEYIAAESIIFEPVISITQANAAI